MTKLDVGLYLDLGWGMQNASPSLNLTHDEHPPPSLDYLAGAGHRLTWWEGTLPVTGGEISLAWLQEKRALRYRIQVPDVYIIQVELVGLDSWGMAAWSLAWATGVVE